MESGPLRNWSQGRPKMESMPPQNGFRAPRNGESKGRSEMESGGLIFSSRFSSFLLIPSSVRGDSCTILTSVKICFIYFNMLNLWTIPLNQKGPQRIYLRFSVMGRRPGIFFLCWCLRNILVKTPSMFSYFPGWDTIVNFKHYIRLNQISLVKRQTDILCNIRDVISYIQCIKWYFICFS